MAATSLLARLGLRIATLGSAASLAIAAPIAEGDVSQAAHTHAARTGFYFPTATSIGVVTTAAERMRFWADGGVQIGGTYAASPGAGNLKINSGNLLVKGAAVTTVTAPATSIHVVQNTNAGLRLDSYAAAGFPGVQVYRARGTDAAPTAVQAGDFLGFIGGYGYGATAFSNQSRVRMVFVANQNWTDTDQGAYVSFWTTANAAITQIERLRINNTSSNPGILQVTDNIATVPTLITIGVQNAVCNFYQTGGSNNDWATVSARSERSGNTGTRMAFFGRAYDTGSVGANSKSYGLLGQSAVLTRGVASVQMVGVYGNASIGTGSPNFSAGSQDTNLPVGSNWFAGVAGVSLGVGAASSINVGVYGRAANALENYAGYFDGAVVVTGGVHFSAYENHAITQVAINTALDGTHYTILVDATSGPITITLPDSTATTGINGRVYNVKKIDASANTVTVQRAGASDLIDGATTNVLTVQYQSRGYQCRTASAAANRWSVI